MNRASRIQPWPAWPIATPGKRAALERVLTSQRWAISGEGTGATTEESDFAREFSAFTGARHCVPTDHGSSALHLAFAVLGIRPGDEVLIPGLTWVACASTVAHLGAVPVLADIDSETLCVSADTLAAGLTDRTRAVLVVHLYCSVAPMAEITAFCRQHSLVLVEDCAQAHGARIDGRHVGTIGSIGTFSMQQGKPMTCGEGGACITDNAELADRMYRLRTDSRRLGGRSLLRGELDNAPPLAAGNRCLSEFQCALLREELADLPALHARRARGAEQLRIVLESITGVRAPRFVRDGVEASFYKLIVYIDSDALAGRSIDALAAALTERLGIWIHPVYDPLDGHPLFDLAKFLVSPMRQPERPLAGCWQVRATALAFPHRMLLAEPDRFDEVHRALSEVLHGDQP